MKRLLIVTLVLASFAISAGAYYELRASPAAVRFETVRATRGDLVANVICTGTLQAIRTVEVATQANGIVKELDADFNSVVHKGQVVARLDPALIQAQIDQGRAQLGKARTDVDRLQVAADEAQRQLERADALAAKQLLDPSDAETTRVAAAQAKADLDAGKAAVAEAQAAVDQNLINLEHTVITSPIDGIVVARNVDVGQTVVSNMQAQTLFQIAEDLSKMQVDTTVDESDIGPVREGDAVSFTVDTYPGETFTGTVQQVRLSPQLDQDVVSYDTVIAVPNPTLRLRPGMTANVTIHVDARHDVLRVPATALHFRPNDELFALLHQNVPSAAHSGAWNRTGSRSSSAAGGRALADARTVWVLRDGRLVPARVEFGLSDGALTEVAGGDVRAGDAVVTNAIEGGK